MKVVLSLLYSAAMLLAPLASCDADTVSVAVAVPPDPDKGELPSVVVPARNVTLPVGVVPLELVTVAVRRVEPPEVSEVELAETTKFGVRRPDVWLDHALSKL